ncbi:MULTISPECIES: HAD domain-containing protein [unclassified Streptomyces]|uniref:HAD domain-containing protein n=2 Tax=Streptomyces TaxID=1883 RepID=UPI002DD85AAA|nr:HAD domain-containing protein [Streptomyces sp. NBC_01445]WSE02772.1 HAD domain-containing protein [Streptomyces sp. NBC_01445]
MTGSEHLPLLFLDVDGPLIPFGGPPECYPTYPMCRPGGPDPLGADLNPLLARINPAYGPRLAALPCELVWATTWMEEANDCVAPLLGLPPLPVVDWPDPPVRDARDEGHGVRGLHWKTRALVGQAQGRPFAWVDDEITDIDRAWVFAHHAERALLHRVDPRRGLTEADFACLDEWLRAAADRSGG